MYHVLIQHSRKRHYVEEVRKMSLGEAIREHRTSLNMSQEQYAALIPIERSVLSRLETNERSCPPEYEVKLASMSWRLALQIANERTGGFISNILGFLPNLDLHPAALKDTLLKEVEELEAALGGLVMARHIDPQKRKESAERVWHEMRDVMEKAAVLQGVIEEEFALDRDRLIVNHEQQIKKGER
jgi:transcriptional regulator with XRE-family HTH domain